RGHEVLEDGASAQLVLGAADDHQRPARECGGRPDARRPGFRVGEVGHARAEPGGESDHERELASRGWNDALEAGRWLAGSGVVPDAALVSSARRAASTWTALAEGGSFE